VLTKSIYLLLICVSHFTASSSNPDESRLRKHLFNPEYQTEDLTTTPVVSADQRMNVDVVILIIKLIDLVNTKLFLRSCLITCIYLPARRNASTVCAMTRYPSVRLSVHPSVTSRSCIKAAKHNIIITQTTRHG